MNIQQRFNKNGIRRLPIYHCARCNFASGNSKVFAQHVALEHPGEGPGFFNNYKLRKDWRNAVGERPAGEAKVEENAGRLSIAQR